MAKVMKDNYRLDEITQKIYFTLTHANLFSSCAAVYNDIKIC